MSDGSPVSNFSGHNGRVMTCSWHPTLTSHVISGAEDGSLHVWDPSDQTRKLPLERKREKKSKKFQGEVVKKSEATDEANTAVKDTKDLSFEELLALHKSEQSKVKKVEASEEQEESVEKPRQILKPSSNRERKVKSVNKKLFFPVSSNSEAKNKSRAAEECLTVFKYHEKQKQRDNTNDDDVAEELEKLKISEKPHLGFFTSRDAVLSLLEAERREQSEDSEAETVLSLWSGDLLQLLETAITESRVTERLLTHAAGVSLVLWRRAAVSLGHQLVREGEVLRGAEYLVSSGQYQPITAQYDLSQPITAHNQLSRPITAHYNFLNQSQLSMIYPNS